jgi:two-component system, chemotaxis family, chemotaxis protein CheY
LAPEGAYNDFRIVEAQGDIGQREVSGGSKGKPILIVDDDADIRMMLAVVLEIRGYLSTEAGDGRDALALLTGGLRPSLILLDLMMPVMSGWDFLASVAKDEQLAGIPIVALTGYGNMVRNQPPLGTVALLGKPIDLPQLETILGRYV